MRETGLVLGLLLLLVLLGVARSMPWLVLLGIGQQVMFGAAAIGIPLELLYFSLLGAVLWHGGGTPRGWYWRSFDHHHLVGPTARWFVLPPFYFGALAFLAMVLGILIVLLALVMAALS